MNSENRQGGLKQDAHTNNTPENFLVQDEIDLSEIFKALWRGKLIILGFSVLFAAFSVLYALKQPDIYRASTTLMPASSGGQSSLGRMAGQFGGLANFAGLSLGGGGMDKTGLALEILNSRAFIENFVRRHDLLAPLIASTGWDKASGELIYDNEMYNAEAKEWSDGFVKPTPWRSYNAFKGILNISQDQETGIVLIQLDFFSPLLAQDWLTLLVRDINMTVRDNDKSDALNSITYLTQKLEQTNLAEMQSVFYQLIEEQTKTMMLAEVSDEYVLKTIDPPNVPDEKAKPKRALIVIFGTLFGGMLSVLFVLVMFFRRVAN